MPLLTIWLSYLIIVVCNKVNSFHIDFTEFSLLRYVLLYSDSNFHINYARSTTTKLRFSFEIILGYHALIWFGTTREIVSHIETWPYQSKQFIQISKSPRFN